MRGPRSRPWPTIGRVARRRVLGAGSARSLGSLAKKVAAPTLAASHDASIPLGPPQTLARHGSRSGNNRPLLVASTNRTAVRGAGLPAAEAPGLDPRATL